MICCFPWLAKRKNSFPCFCGLPQTCYYGLIVDCRPPPNITCIPKTEAIISALGFVSPRLLPLDDKHQQLLDCMSTRAIQTRMQFPKAEPRIIVTRRSNGLPALIQDKGSSLSPSHIQPRALASNGRLVYLSARICRALDMSSIPVNLRRVVRLPCSPGQPRPASTLTISPQLKRKTTLSIVSVTIAQGSGTLSKTKALLVSPNLSHACLLLSFAASALFLPHRQSLLQRPLALPKQKARVCPEKHLGVLLQKKQIWVIRKINRRKKARHFVPSHSGIDPLTTYIRHKKGGG